MLAIRHTPREYRIQRNATWRFDLLEGPVLRPQQEADEAQRGARGSVPRARGGEHRRTVADRHGLHLRLVQVRVQVVEDNRLHLQVHRRLDQRGQHQLVPLPPLGVGLCTTKSHQQFFFYPY